MNETDEMKLRSQEDFKKDAMEAIGWDTSSAIPMANKENLDLLNELTELTEEKFDLNEKIKQLDERDKALRRHKINITGALNQNLKIYSAITKDLHEESHLYQLAHLEHTKLLEDLKKNGKEFDEYHQYVSKVEHEICNVKNDIDDLTGRVKWAKTALIEWNEAMEEGNKGFQLIEKYFKEDQQKVREKNQRRVQIEAEIAKQRKRVIELYDEQNTLEKNLERTATLYRKAHAERRQMVETWKHAVHNMTQRENDIINGELDLENMKAEAKHKAAELKLYDDRLNDLINNNHEIEQAIEELNTNSSDIKGRIQKIVDLCILKQNEVDLLQKELSNLAHRVELQRAENRHNQKEKAAKALELEKFSEVLKTLEDRLNLMQGKNMNANQRLQMLEEMNDSEQKAVDDIAREAERISGILFRTQQQICDLKNEEKILSTNSSGLKSTVIAVGRNAKKTEQELKRQTEIHYDLGFKFLTAERKLTMMRGSTVDPEIEQKNVTLLAQLEQENLRLQRRIQTTEAQNKKLNYSMNTLVMAFNNDNYELEHMKFKIKEAQVYCEGSIKRLKSDQFNNQELIVELSLVKMRANDLELEIAECEQGTYNLEQHRLELKRTMKDRMVELKSQEALLRLKLKHLNEERSTLRADLGERSKHIAAMRSRFELTSKLLGTNEDGSLITATQLKVQNAQEKQILADEGDELNKKVLKAEEEVIALENTLREFDKANSTYRKVFQKVDGDSETVDKELKQMEEHYCKELHRLKMLRCKARRYEYELDISNKTKTDLEKRLQDVRAKRLENSEILAKLKKELSDQQAKIQRAEKDIKRAMKQIKQRALGDEYMEMFERQLDLNELETRNLKALNQLSDMAASDEICGPHIIRQLLQKEISLPQQLQPSPSFSSICSEMSEVSCQENKKTARSSTTSLVSSDQSSSTHVSVISLEFPSAK